MNNLDNRKIALLAQLRDLRAAAGLSGSGLAKKNGWAQSKVSRIETGKQAVTDSDIVAWCEATSSPEAVTAALLEELRDIRLEESRWQRRLASGNEALLVEAGAVEHAASVIKVFELAVVPGLVQTADYARHVFLSVSELHRSPSDTEAAVRARLARQAVLYDTTKRVEILLTEWALRSFPCPPSVMGRQIDRLLSLLELDTLRLGIVPANVRIPAVAMNGFWIIDEHVRAETVNAEITVSDPEDVGLYNRLLDGLWSVAVEGEQARALLTRVAAEL